MKRGGSMGEGGFPAGAGRRIVNHKELVPLEHYLALYRTADPETIAGRTGVKIVKAGQETGTRPSSPVSLWFEMTFLGRPYRIGWPDFDIECPGGERGWSLLHESSEARLLVLRFLLEGRSLESTGRFLTFREVPWGEVYDRQFTGRCIKRLAFTYGGRIGDYRSRMEKLGARPVDQSDAGCELELFPGYRIRFLIWEGDDDFPPSAQILFSDNFAAAFHAEDLVVAAEVLIGALKQV